MEEKLIPLTPSPKGVNQRAAETDLPEGSLREAVNVTLDSAGKPKRRTGYTKLLDLSSGHSLWSNNTTIICAHQGDLWSVDPDALTTALLREGVGNDPISYAVVNNWLFYTSERASGRINLYSLEHKDHWGCPHPQGNATLSTGAGNLPAGQYQVVVTWVDDSGQESGAEAPEVITLAAPGGIHLTNIPQGGASTIRIYCSMVNDTALYRQATLTMGTMEHTITQLRRGKECTTLFHEPLPAGHIARYYKGRVLVAKDNMVYYSNALHYGLYEPDMGYLPPFPEKVTVIEAVEDGFYVGADRTYFVRGSGPDDFSISVASSHKPILGSSLQVEAKHIIPEYVGYVAYWMTEEGPTVGVNGGMIQALSLGALTGTMATSGASGILRDDGVDRVVTSLLGGAPRSGFAAYDSSTIEIIRSN